SRGCTAAAWARNKDRSHSPPPRRSWLSVQGSGSRRQARSGCVLPCLAFAGLRERRAARRAQARLRAPPPLQILELPAPPPAVSPADSDSPSEPCPPIRAWPPQRYLYRRTLAAGWLCSNPALAPRAVSSR